MMASGCSQICSYKDCCQGGLLALGDRVEVRTTLPKKKPATHFQVSWWPSGDAVFHRDCWELVTKASRSRSKQRSVFIMNTTEKSLVREATKTAEFHDSNATLEIKAARVAGMIREAKYCVAFTGAGISTSAGIGDYRGKSGKWTEEERLASGDESASESASVEEGVHYEDLRPTYTHEALYKLFQMGYVKHIISQNGDGLHGLSGFSCENLSELHGNVFIEKCEKCGRCYERPYYVLDDHASLYFEELNDLGQTTIKKPKNAKQCMTCGLTHRTGRRCTKKGCKGFLMDTIINFGDNLDDVFTTAANNAEKSDLMLCLGTTMTVTPANELVEMGKKPSRLIICNRQKTEMDKVCQASDPFRQPLGSRVFGDCDSLMRKVMLLLLSQQDIKEWEKERSLRLVEYNKMRTPN